MPRGEALPERPGAPPSQQEILWEWFLGEAKEISEQIAAAQQAIDSAAAAIGELNTATRTQIDELNRASIAAHRDLQKTANQISETQSKQRPADVRQAVREATRGGLMTVACVALAGAFIGGLTATACMMWVVG